MKPNTPPEAAQVPHGLDSGQLKRPKFILSKFTLYETKSKIYIVGSTNRETRFRILEIEITWPADRLVVRETRPPLSRAEVMQELARVEEASKNEGGLAKRLTGWGILGFIRFTAGYYISIITKRSVVALIGGHYVYHIDKTELVPLCHRSVYKKPDRRSLEARFLSTFLSLDLGRTFYYSNSYDVTHSLQMNLIREKCKALAAQLDGIDDDEDGDGKQFMDGINTPFDESLRDGSLADQHLGTNAAAYDTDSMDGRPPIPGSESATATDTDTRTIGPDHSRDRTAPETPATETPLEDSGHSEFPLLTHASLLSQRALPLPLPLPQQQQQQQQSRPHSQLADDENEYFRRQAYEDYNERFVWNTHLLEPIRAVFSGAMDWCVAMIHGFMDQAKIVVCGRSIFVTIIARRSHYFAGARFLKRGINVQGNVANEVETEQIVSDHLTTSMHDNRNGIFNSPRYTSYVQHRGSIPLYWSQDISNISPKPPIELNAVDPYYSAAALHFDDMFERYGGPILVLNLVKQRERLPRESILGHEFASCVGYLNKFLPEEKRLHYTAWDMSRASKSRGLEVIEFLEAFAEDTIERTGFFHNGKNLAGMRLQDGVCRTNCIDCLDRTNAAQFVIGKKVLGYQLHALGVLDSPTTLEYDSDAVNLLTEMFHDHGDTIALQYGGSHLVNTMETYRKINQWTSHSRDMIESIRRFYSNSFIDAQRQDAINLFLGNYVWREGQPMLWDLSTDFYLHNDLGMLEGVRRSYTRWWTPANLYGVRDRVEDAIERLGDGYETFEPLLPYPSFYDNYWNEYYRPRMLTSLKSTFTFNMNSTTRYLPSSPQSSGSAHASRALDAESPFVPRRHHHHHHQQHQHQQQNGGRIGSRRGRRDSVSSTVSTLPAGSSPTSMSWLGAEATTGGIRRQAMKRASLIYQSRASTPDGTGDDAATTVTGSSALMPIPALPSNPSIPSSADTSPDLSSGTALDQSLPQLHVTPAVHGASTIHELLTEPRGAWTILPVDAGDTATKVEQLLDPHVPLDDADLYESQVQSRLRDPLASEYAVYARSLDEVIDDIAVSDEDRRLYRDTYSASHMPIEQKTFDLDPQAGPLAAWYNDWLYSEA